MSDTSKLREQVAATEAKLELMENKLQVSNAQHDKDIEHLMHASRQRDIEIKDLKCRVAAMGIEQAKRELRDKDTDDTTMEILRRLTALEKASQVSSSENSTVSPDQASGATKEEARN